MVKDLAELVTEIVNSLPNGIPLPSDIAKATIDNIRCRKIINMAPFMGASDKAKLVNFVIDVWAVLTDLETSGTDKALYVLHMSYFVQTVVVTWDSDGRSQFNKFKVFSSAFPFYLGIVEPALKRKKVPRMTKQLFSAYNNFHGLIVKLDNINKKELIPGSIGNLGVGGFHKEKMDDQIQILMKVEGTITFKAVQTAYDSYERSVAGGEEPMGAFLLKELGLETCGHEEMVSRVREYKEAMLSREQRSSDPDWDERSKRLAEIAVRYGAMDLSAEFFERLEDVVKAMFREERSKLRLDGQVRTMAERISIGVAALDAAGPGQGSGAARDDDAMDVVL